MKCKVLSMTTIVCAFIFIAAGYAQEKAAPGEPVAPAASEPDIQWLWGEVTGVSDSSITVKTLDYETDNEKEVTLLVDEKTAYENVKGVSEIKAQDTVSIDYIVTPDGKNHSRNVSVEKPEPAAPAEQAAPAAGEVTAAPAVAAAPAAVTTAPAEQPATAVQEAPKAAPEAPKAAVEATPAPAKEEPSKSAPAGQ